MLKKRTMSRNKDLEVVFVSHLEKLDSPFQPKNIKELTYSNFEHTSVYSYSIPLASNGLCKARITEFSIIFEKFLFICFFTLILKKNAASKKNAVQFKYPCNYFMLSWNLLFDWKHLWAGRLQYNILHVLLWEILSTPIKLL